MHSAVPSSTVIAPSPHILFDAEKLRALDECRDENQNEQVKITYLVD